MAEKLMIPKLKFNIRKYNPNTDKAFVVFTWLKSMKRDYEHKDWDIATYNKVVRREVNKFLESKCSNVLIAYEPSDPSYLYGWVATSVIGAQEFFLYGFVKPAFRMQGIFKSMLTCAMPQVMAKGENVLCWYWCGHLKRLRQAGKNIFVNYWKERR